MALLDGMKPGGMGLLSQMMGGQQQPAAQPLMQMAGANATPSGLGIGMPVIDMSQGLNRPAGDRGVIVGPGRQRGTLSVLPDGGGLPRDVNESDLKPLVHTP